MHEIDLFNYPRAPGFKERTTSRDAARAAAPGAAILRERVYAAFAGAGSRGLTADEAAAIVGRDWRSVRPRVTELAKADPPRIVPTGERRRNDTDQSAKVWRTR
jgi:hypothetical protein